MRYATVGRSVAPASAAISASAAAISRSCAGPVTRITGTYGAFFGASFCITESMPIRCAPRTVATRAKVPGWSFMENRR